MNTATKKLPPKWKMIEAGAYGDRMVKFDGLWFALYDEFPRRIIGRPMECLVYYRTDFKSDGVYEARLMVASDNSAKED